MRLNPKKIMLLIAVAIGVYGIGNSLLTCNQFLVQAEEAHPTFQDK
jgi:hypothetical protein